MANKILVFLEQRDGKIKKASFQAAKAAADMGKTLNFEVEALTIGNEIENLDKVGGYGINKVVHLKNSELALYSPTGYRDALVNYTEESGDDIFFFANTSLGKDLAPRVAVKLDAGIAMDCIKLQYDGGQIIASRPVYAGKAIVDVEIKNPKKVYTLRPNVFDAGTPLDTAANVEVKELTDVNLSTKVTEIKRAGGKLDVAEAEIIVSGGRGMKGPENFHLIEELADELGGAVGASRAAVDAGWRPHSDQVGQTGKTVSPNLYIAVGISGAIQHIAGMRSSKYIVAINKDEEAPIFSVADYGIVADLFDVVPVLTEEIKKLKAK
jgi:electron transfer flavoprotein alpha subunit